MSYVFGPVPSRRLGRSLGVDLVPFKTCTYDCIYCQLGRTTCHTAERRPYVPLDDVLAEVRSRLPSRPDYITLSGSGEPTLYSRTGELIDGIKAMTDVPVAVLTNGSLLWHPEVCRELSGADVVIPSLDAGDERLFRAINRPHEEITFERLLDGLIRFREAYAGQYWLEVFLLAGHNAMEAEVARIGRHVARIRPHRVQLNTVTRPPAEDFAAAVPPRRLAELAAMLGQDVEVIAEHHAAAHSAELAAGREEVLDLLRRRPCTIDDVADGLGIHRNEAIKLVEDLCARRLLTSRRLNGKVYYRPA